MEQARSSSLSSARRRPFKPDPCLVSPAYNRQSMVQKLIVTDEEDRASYVKVKRGTTVRQLRESLQKVDGPLSTSPTGAMSDPNAYVFLNGGVSVADEGRITVAAILPKLSLASARPHTLANSRRVVSSPRLAVTDPFEGAGWPQLQANLDKLPMFTVANQEGKPLQYEVGESNSSRQTMGR